MNKMILWWVPKLVCLKEGHYIDASTDIPDLSDVLHQFPVGITVCFMFNHIIIARKRTIPGDYRERVLALTDSDCKTVKLSYSITCNSCCRMATRMYSVSRGQLCERCVRYIKNMSIRDSHRSTFASWDPYNYHPMCYRRAHLDDYVEVQMRYHNGTSAELYVGDLHMLIKPYWYSKHALLTCVANDDVVQVILLYVLSGIHL